MDFGLIFQQLALYNQWINRRIYDASGRLNTNDINSDRGAYFKSVIGTLNHILVGDIFWFKRFSQHFLPLGALEYFHKIDRPESLDSIFCDSLFDLRFAREAADESIIHFSSSLTEAMLASTVVYSDSAGNEYKKNFGCLLLHVFNHQTHHRGQVSTLLNQYGVDFGVTDMLECIPNGPLMDGLSISP